MPVVAERIIDVGIAHKAASGLGVPFRHETIVVAPQDVASPIPVEIVVSDRLEANLDAAGINVPHDEATGAEVGNLDRIRSTECQR